MADIILHHYATSPFSELLRIALGHKQLSWRSVTIPSVAPKPDLVPLTGGYRKTPVLQIGADIYCGTPVAIDALEALAPEPTFFPQPLGRLAGFIADWAGGPLFAQAIGAAIAPIADHVPAQFWADREALFGFERGRVVAGASHLAAQTAASFARFDAALADGRSFLGGEAAGHADFAVYMDVWFQEQMGNGKALAPFPNLFAWSERVAAIGHGVHSDMSAEDAIGVAKRNEHRGGSTVQEGWMTGQPVIVRTEDPGADDVAGRLLTLTATAIAIERDDPRAGTVAVHFPRLGQIIRPA